MASLEKKQSRSECNHMHSSMKSSLALRLGKTRKRRGNRQQTVKLEPFGLSHRIVYDRHTSHPYYNKVESDLSEKDRSSLANSLAAARQAMRFLSKHQDYRVRLPVLTNLDSDAGGIISYSLNWANVNTAGDWSSLSALFDEFRVRAIEFVAEPKNKYSKVTTISRPIIMTHDNDGNTTVGSYDTVAQYPQSRTSNTDDLFHKPVIWTRDASPSSTLLGEMWTDVADVANTVGTTLIYGDGLTASANYGIVFQYFIVDFRFAR